MFDTTFYENRLKGVTVFGKLKQKRNPITYYKILQRPLNKLV